MSGVPRHELKKLLGQKANFTAIFGATLAPVEMNCFGEITLQRFVACDLRAEDGFLRSDHVLISLTPSVRRQIDQCDLYEGDRIAFQATVTAYQKLNKWWRHPEFLKMKELGKPTGDWVKRQAREVEDYNLTQIKKIALVHRRRPDYVPFQCGLLAQAFYESLAEQSPPDLAQIAT